MAKPLNKLNFLSELFEKHQISNCYKRLCYTFNNASFYESPGINEEILKKQPLVETNVAFPKFLNPEFNNYNNQLGYKKINQKYQNCYGIIIPTDLKNPTEYLHSKFSSNSRIRILKKMRRLENSFNISYKVFYGKIDESDYKFIMGKTHKMLARRFEQKNDTNFVLNSWEKYLNLLYSLINEKKASLFVIYSDNTPIQVSINFHFQKTLFFYILAHNIDYSQFGLGNISVFKGIEWCIKNNYDYLDMGNGELDYKKRWCNHHYVLETHIHYKKDNLLAKVLAIKELNTIKIKNVLKTIINSHYYNKIKSIIFKNTSENNDNYLFYNTFKLNNLNNYSNKNLLEIDFKNESAFHFLHKSIWDFLYATTEHINNIMVFKVTDENDVFIIKGANSILKVQLIDK